VTASSETTVPSAPVPWTSAVLAMTRHELRMLLYAPLSYLFLAGFAALAMAEGDETRGARLAGAMAGLRDLTGTDLVNVGLPPVPGIDVYSMSSLEGELGRIYEEGRLMTATDAVAFALRAID